MPNGHAKCQDRTLPDFFSTGWGSRAVLRFLQCFASFFPFKIWGTQLWPTVFLVGWAKHPNLTSIVHPQHARYLLVNFHEILLHWLLGWIWGQWAVIPLSDIDVTRCDIDVHYLSTSPIPPSPTPSPFLQKEDSVHRDEIWKGLDTHLVSM